MADSYTFKVEPTDVQAYGVVVLIKAPGSHPEAIKFQPNGEGDEPLEKGDYTIFWSFWGNTGSSLKITISDSNAKKIAEFSDKLEAKDGSSKLNTNVFKIS